MKEIGVLTIIVSGIGIIVCTVAMQLIRERMVAVLIHRKSPISQIISSWSLHQNGYVEVFNKGVLWGAMSKEIMLVKDAKKIINFHSNIFNC